ILERAEQLASRVGFFHWQLEFSEVFERANPGFDAVIGNPPWEIEKPNSREFFGRFDDSYWQHGKQAALAGQQQWHERDAALQQLWAAYQSEAIAFRKWIKWSAHPSENTGTPSNRPFQHQGKADLNAYKLFLEAGHNLLRDDGILSLIVPAGIYSDLGAQD